LAEQEAAMSLSANEPELKLLYTELEELYEQYTCTGDSNLKAKITSLLKKVNRKEQAIYKAHVGLAENLRKGFLENKIEIAAREEKLYALFNEHRTFASTQEEKAKLEKLRDIR